MPNDLFREDRAQAIGRLSKLSVTLSLTICCRLPNRLNSRPLAIRVTNSVIDPFVRLIYFTLDQTQRVTQSELALNDRLYSQPFVGAQ